MDPDGSSFLWPFVLLLVLIACNAFFSMSEIAVISMGDNKLRRLAQEGSREGRQAQKLLRLVEKPSGFLATIQVGVTFSGFLASAVAADNLAYRLVERASGLPFSGGVLRGLSLVVITLLLSFCSLVLGELVPKRIAMQNCEKIALAAAGPLSFLYRLERPFVALLSAVTNGILRLMGIDPDQKPETVTEEEIRMMIDVGNESGSIEESDKEMINGIFAFDDRNVSDMMTHRTEVVAVELGTPLSKIVALAVETGYSRIPIYADDLDEILGILYVKDLLKLIRGGSDEEFDLKAYMREPLYVPESTKCKTLLTEFQQKKLQMAIVVDEYGGTSGLVTMEDLLESIVGNIQDEYDDEEEDISPLTEDSFLVDGLTSMEEISKFFSIEFPEEEDFDTIGGYIVNRLGRIPSEAEHSTVQVGNVQFTVSEVDERRIAKLRALRLPEILEGDRPILEI